MGNWVLNTSYLRENQTDIGFPQIFTYETRLRHTPFREDDDMLILDSEPNKKGYRYEREWKNNQFNTFRFTAFGLIRRIGQGVPQPYSRYEIRKNERRELDKKPPLPQRKHYPILLEIDQKLNQNNNFNDLAYSLISIHNYQKPISHFQQQARSVVDNDLETIRKGRIYLARTTFGKMVNALPYENKFEFSVIISRKYKTYDFKGLEFVSILKDLMDYVENRFHRRGELIVKTDNMLRGIENQARLDSSLTLNEDELSLEGVGFYDETLRKGDDIRVQADLFRDMFNNLKESNLWDTVRDEVLKDPERDFFRSLFRNRRWPLIFNQ